MKKIIPLLIACFVFTSVYAQVVSMRVVQGAYSAVDPDGAGPATGSVVIRFEVMSTIAVVADGIGLTFVFQSSKLMATPTNTTVLLGPLAAAAGWTQQVDNRVGTAIGTVTYGGQSFDTRMIITFNVTGGVPNATIGTAWTAVAAVTYWTKGVGYPEGGYIVNQPGSIVAQAELSTDGGLSTYLLQSPNLGTPTPLGAVAVPVTFTSFVAKCNGNGTLLTWATAQESNSKNFEIQKSANGSAWETVANLPAAGNSASNRNYQQLDLSGGSAFYRIKQVDLDGQFIYTVIERTNCASKNISSVIYPVPARDVLNVVIKSDRMAKTQLMVYEASGRLVRKVDVALVSGNNSFKVNTTGLAAGDYLIRSSNKDVDLNKVFTVVN